MPDRADTGTRRPRVVTYNATSVDGRVAISPGALLMSDSRWPSDGSDPYADLKRRHGPQVILEGSGSFVVEHEVPEPLPPAEAGADALRTDFLPEEALARATAGWMAVVDGRGRVRWAYKEYPGEAWAGWHLLVLVSGRTPLDYLAYLRGEVIPYLVAGDARVDLAAALAALASRLGVRSVVSTGGGRLSGALLRAGLIDEIEVEVLPIAVGGTETPALFTAPDLDREALPTSLRLIAADVRPGGRVLLRYDAAAGHAPDPGPSAGVGNPDASAPTAGGP
jgi:riboflavin biosynthesis pyrimidine reductase